MKNNQDLIEEKEKLFDFQKQSLLLSAILEADFLLKLGGKKALEEWRDGVLDEMNRLKKQIQDLKNN